MADLGATFSDSAAGPASSEHHEHQISCPECTRPEFIVEFLLYLAFIITFSVVVNNVRDPKYSFLQVSLMDDLLLEEEYPALEFYRSFKHTTTLADVWTFLTDVFPTQLLSDYGAGEYVPYGVNFIAGSVRLRQVRVKPAICSLHQDFYPQLRNCFGRYSLGDEDRAPYGPNSSWTYSSCDVLGSACSQYARLRRYDGGGYVVYLDSGSMATEVARMQQLKRDNWIDLLTRAVFIDFAAYNPAVNMFLVSQLTFEFLPTGGVIADSKFRTLRLYRYEGDGGASQLAGEIAIVCFVALFMLEEFVQIALSCVRIRRNVQLRKATGLYRYSVSYFHDAWNYLDWLNVLIFGFVFYCRYRVDTSFSALKLVPEDRSRFYDLTTVTFWDSTEKVMLAGNAFLLWFKVFKFAVVLFPRMGLIVNVISVAFLPLFSFIIMFMFVLMGFAQAGAIAFGTDVEGFDTIGKSAFTVLLAVLGQRDFNALRHSNRAFGPLFFFVFVLLVVFIALSMFLTIVDSSYDDVHKSMERNEEPSLLSKALVLFSRTKVGARLTNALDMQDKLQDLRQSIERVDLNRDGMVSEQELQILVAEQRDFFEGAASDLMERYDVDNDNMLSADERMRMYRDIEREHSRVAMKILSLAGAPTDEYKLVFELLTDRLAKTEARLEAHIEIVAKNLKTARQDPAQRSEPETLVPAKPPPHQRARSPTAQ